MQWDGAGTADTDRVLVVGATNRPGDLDEAARRRCAKTAHLFGVGCRLAFCVTRSFYQDRLGTNARTAREKEAFLQACEAHLHSAP